MKQTCETRRGAHGCNPVLGRLRLEDPNFGHLVRLLEEKDKKDQGKNKSRKRSWDIKLASWITVKTKLF